MTKYYFRSEVYDTHGYPVEAVAGEGDWEKWDDVLYVKAEEAQALEQLNKEMLEVLKGCLPHIEVSYGSEKVQGTSLKCDWMLSKKELIDKIQSIIKQAEEA